MEISWFEIIAQIFNFFLLLFILQYFFYKPVTKAMSDRQKRISKSEKESDSKMHEAEELIKNYDTKILEIESEKKSILAEYRKEALETKESLLEEYKKEANNKRKSYITQVEEEKENFIEKVRQDLGKNAVKIASKILGTITSQELEEEVYKTFINDIKNIKENINNSNILEEESNINLISSRELNENKKTEIEETLRNSGFKIKDINYEVNQDLILGFELNLDTYTIHNSVHNYLDEVEKNIRKTLQNQNL